jgi:predicted membrane metal-binding protein
MELLWVDHSREIFLWDVFYFFLVILLIVSFLFRKVPILGALWNLFAVVFVAWFVILGIDMAKKSLKNWWDK